jgi:hypothetical protein
MVESFVGWVLLHKNPEPDPGIRLVKMVIDAGTYASILMNFISRNETTQLALLIFSGFWYAAFLIDKFRSCSQNTPRLPTRFLS